jgi:hypothetical protein
MGRPAKAPRPLTAKERTIPLLHVSTGPSIDKSPPKFETVKLLGFFDSLEKTIHLSMGRRGKAICGIWIGNDDHWPRRRTGGKVCRACLAAQPRAEIV